MSWDKKPRILVFTDTFFEVNGIGTYYRTLIDWCRQSGAAEVRVLCPARDDLHNGSVPEEVIAVRPRLHLPNPLYKDMPIGLYAKGELRSLVSSLTAGNGQGSPVIHIATSGPLGAAGRWAARKLNLPSVGFFHTDFHRIGPVYGRSLLGAPGAKLARHIACWFDKRAYRSCRALGAPSVSASETARRFFPGEPVVLPYPLNLGRFQPAPSRGGAFREQYGRKGAVLAVVVGRAAKEKNLDLICELLLHDPRLNVVFVGDGPHRPAVERRWGARFTGFLHGDELKEAYQQSDLFVQLSVTETFGLCLAEAMACGLPAVVLRAPGFVESIPPGQGVDVLETDELPQLADRCVALCADPAIHQEHGRRAHQFAQRSAPEIVLPKFIDLHRACASLR
jgi:glycosyltransferase involved in cell wall biosynthesis